MILQLVYQGNLLGLTAPSRSETMLAASKNVVSVEVSHGVADNYMFKHLTTDAGKRYRPVVTGFELFTLLVYCRTLDVSHTSGIDSVSMHFW